MLIGVGAFQYFYNRHLSFPSSLQFLQSIVRERYQGNTSADLFVHFVGGGLAGITAASVTYPLDLVRTRLAAQVNFCYC